MKSISPPISAFIACRYGASFYDWSPACLGWVLQSSVSLCIYFLKLVLCNSLPPFYVWEVYPSVGASLNPWHF